MYKRIITLALVLSVFSFAIDSYAASFLEYQKEIYSSINSKGVVKMFSRSSRAKSIAESSYESKKNSNSAYLEYGYPISTYHGAGSYQGGAFIDITVNDFDGDGLSEIIHSSLANGPLNVFNNDGSVLPGFPKAGNGVGYSASLDNYVITAFTYGGCNPGCVSVVKMFDSKGNTLWSHNTIGIGVDSAPVMFKKDGDIYALYEDSSYLHLVDVNGNEMPNWPKNPNRDGGLAVADLTGDDSPEIIVANSDGNVYILNWDGSLHAQAPYFGEQVRLYPVVGDVDGDNDLEIVLIGRESAPPWRSQVKVIESDGTLSASIQVQDKTTYGAQTSLADVDNDGVPEILFLGDQKAHVLNGDGSYVKGWPKVHEYTSVYSKESNIVVGDIYSDTNSKLPEIVYTLREGNGNDGHIMIYNHDGSPVDAWDSSVVYPLSSGRSNAIADIDGDSYNEILIGESFWDGISGYYPSIWAFDLNRNQKTVAHQEPEWAGYSNDSGKTGLYR